MKQFLPIIFLLTLGVPALADSFPELKINDEQFREAVESGLTQSNLLASVSAQAVIQANVNFANRTCSIRLSVEDPGYHFTGNFSRNAKSIEKCKTIVAKYVAQGGLPF